MKKGLIFVAFCVFGFNDLNCAEAMSPSNPQACAMVNNNDDLNKRLEILRNDEFTKPFESKDQYKEIDLGAEKRLSIIFGYYNWNGIKVIDVSYKTLFNYVCNNHPGLDYEIKKIMAESNEGFKSFLIENQILSIEKDSSDKCIEHALEKLIESKSGRELLGKFIILKKLQEKKDNIVGFFKTVRLETNTYSCCDWKNSLVYLNPSQERQGDITIRRDIESDNDNFDQLSYLATLMHELAHQFHHFIGLDAFVMDLEGASGYPYDGSLVRNLLYSMLSHRDIAEKFSPFLNESFCKKFADEVDKLANQNKINKEEPRSLGGLLVNDYSELLDELGYTHLQILSNASFGGKIAKFYCNAFLQYWDTHEENLTISGIGPYWFHQKDGSLLPLLIADEQNENSYLNERFGRYRLLHVSGRSGHEGFSKDLRSITQNLINEFGLFLDPTEIQKGDDVTHTSPKTSIQQSKRFEKLWEYLEYVLANKQVNYSNILGVCDLIQHFTEDKEKKTLVLKLLKGFPEFVNIAVESNSVVFLSCLINEYGCNFNIQAQWGKTPVHYAAQYGHLDIVKYLVEYGFKGGENDAGNDEVDFYIESRINLKDKYSCVPLHYAAQYGHLDIVKYFVEQCHCDIEAKDKDGNTPLINAMRYGYFDIVEYLVKECHCDVEVKDKCGNTPLINAVRYDHFDIVKCLIDDGHCKVEVKDSSGWTPLYIASQNGYLDIVKYLVEEGHCNIEAKNNAGMTSLHIAAQKCRIDIVKYLIEECHCNIEAEDNAGRIPLDMARSNKIKEYLQRKSHPVRYFIKKHPVATTALTALTLAPVIALSLHFIGIF